jgi:hypothetical protein
MRSEGRWAYEFRLSRKRAARICGIEEGIEEMLTMKHVMCPEPGGRSEFARSIGCYAVKRKDGYFQFLAYDKRDTDTPDVWSGWDSDRDFKDPVVGTIYVMNEAGATIANYSYVMDGAVIEPMWDGPPPATEEEAAEEAERLAA